MLQNIFPDVLAAVFLIITLILVPLHFINSLWLAPKKLEKCLRDQGFHGNPYRPIYGDVTEINHMAASAVSKPLSSLTHDIITHIMPFCHHIIQRYGKDSFMWFGTNPRVNITKPEFIREIFTKFEIYHKKSPGRSAKFGLVMREGEDWTKVRRIINPAFHMEKLKNMLPVMEICCDMMIRNWEEMVAKTGSAEVDVYSSLNSLSGDVIARTTFGSSYEEGKRLFKLQEEVIGLAFQELRSISNYIPGWRYSSYHGLCIKVLHKRPGWQ